MPQSCHRGVWSIPGISTDGDVYLFVLDSHNRHVITPMKVSEQEMAFVGEDLWRVLNAADPNPKVPVGTPPLFQPLRRALRIPRTDQEQQAAG